MVPVAAVLLLLTFLVSGVSKIVSLGSIDAARFSKLTGIPAPFSAAIITCAGIWELISCTLIYQGFATSNKALVNMGAQMLVAFTIAATLIFYVKPFKQIPVLTNLSMAGGLLLLPLAVHKS